MHFVACHDDGHGAAATGGSPVSHQRAAGLLKMPMFVERDHCRPAAPVDDLGYAGIDSDTVEPDKGVVGSPQEAEADGGKHSAGGAYQCRLATIKLTDKVV